MTRTAWKAYYRQFRICRRESHKAAMDVLLFGVGFIRVSNDGFVNHLLPQSVSLR